MWPAPVSPARKVNSYLTQVYTRLCVQSIHLYEWQYSLYETGRRRLPAEMLAPLCRALGVSADYLLGLPRGLSWPR